MSSVNPSAIHAKVVELGKHVLRMTTKAGSGHPSSALAIGHITVELMYRTMRYDPADPWNSASDRFVLSIGHAVPMVYAAYADLSGCVGRAKSEARALTVDDLLTLRELSSVLDGHPNPAEGFPFFDAATGSLGQGLSVGAGLALAARLSGIEKRIYVVVGDGEAREGQVWEAADFIVDQNLSQVCAVFSCNGHGQAGPVSAQQSAQIIARKMGAFGWHVLEIDGHDPVEIDGAFAEAKLAGRPTAIVARTVKGWGVDTMLHANFHGKPLSKDDLDRGCHELEATGKTLGAAPGDFAYTTTAKVSPDRQAANPKKPIQSGSFEAALKKAGLESAWDKKKLATRVAYGVALAALGDADDRIVAVDGDVSNSTFSNLFAKAHPKRFVECKIAEQNMISTAAGLSAGGMIPFASTFAKFVARAVDQIDMAIISRANVKIVGSHSGVSLGADGPSQMATSDVAYFRSVTKVDSGDGWVACHLFHPSDPVSAFRCTELMANVDGVCYLRTHRPVTPFLYDPEETFSLDGWKQLRRGDRITLVSSGYMLHTVLEAADRLSSQGVRCNVFDAYCFPLQADAILRAAEASGRIILTIEDNYIGGLHSELAEAAAERGGIRVAGLTAQRIPKSAKTAAEVFSYVGVGLEDIVAKATKLTS